MLKLKKDLRSTHY